LEYEGYDAVRDEEASAVQSFISNLSGAFDSTVELYEDLKHRELHQRTDLVTHLYALFVQMNQKLERLVGSGLPNAAKPSAADQNELLEKYSDLLVAKVMAKLEPKK